MWTSDDFLAQRDLVVRDAALALALERLQAVGGVRSRIEVYAGGSPTDLTGATTLAVVELADPPAVVSDGQLSFVMPIEGWVANADPAGTAPGWAAIYRAEAAPGTWEYAMEVTTDESAEGALVLAPSDPITGDVRLFNGQRCEVVGLVLTQAVGDGGV